MLRELSERFDVIGGSLLQRWLDLEQQIIVQRLDSVERLLIVAQLSIGHLLLGHGQLLDGGLLGHFLSLLLVLVTLVVRLLGRLSLSLLRHLRAQAVELRQQLGDLLAAVPLRGGREQLAVQIVRNVAGRG